MSTDLVAHNTPPVQFTALTDLLSKDGSFSNEGDVSASEPGQRLVATRRAWISLAARAAGKAGEAQDALRRAANEALIVAGCSIRGFLQGQELLVRSWNGGPTKSGCDQVSPWKLAPFKVSANNPRRTVRSVSTGYCQT